VCVCVCVCEALHCVAQLNNWNSAGCCLVWNQWKICTKNNMLGMMVWKIWCGKIF